MERMQPFELQRPMTLAQAVAMLASHPAARLLAGGTDLLPNLRRGIEQPTHLIDLGGVRDLDDITLESGSVTIGAGVTLARLAADRTIAAEWRALSQAAGSVAAPGHRNAATVGGNLCLDTRCVFYNQSEWWRAANDHCLKRGGEVCHVAPQGQRCHAAFCGDLAPALLVFDAEVELVASRATRRMPLADLYRDDGAAHLAIARDEVLARVMLPTPAAALRSGYRKARTRASTDFPLAGVACALALRNGCVTQLRIAMTGTNVRPFLVEGVDALTGRPVDAAMLAALGKLVQKQASPARTTVTPSHYRRQVAAVLAQRLLRELADAASVDAAARAAP
jgi:4-hydroxybenzoyl-CoA reductase subunit beta